MRIEGGEKCVHPKNNKAKSERVYDKKTMYMKKDMSI